MVSLEKLVSETEDGQLLTISITDDDSKIVFWSRGVVYNLTEKDEVHYEGDLIQQDGAYQTQFTMVFFGVNPVVPPITHIENFDYGNLPTNIFVSPLAIQRQFFKDRPTDTIKVSRGETLVKPAKAK